MISCEKCYHVPVCKIAEKKGDILKEEGCKHFTPFYINGSKINKREYILFVPIKYERKTKL